MKSNAECAMFESTVLQSIAGGDVDILSVFVPAALVSVVTRPYSSLLPASSQKTDTILCGPPSKHQPTTTAFIASAIR